MLSLTLPYMGYTPSSPAYTQYPPATYDQEPDVASPPWTTSFVGYGYPASMPQALSREPPRVPLLCSTRRRSCSWTDAVRPVPAAGTVVMSPTQQTDSG
ncbi:RNA-binding protein 38 [Sciurus carolinensis]|uniref:RNA-binding protein 38 n=1 Tax=Sciurus carolinensis TaxID=30640 RepID=A0AA41MLR3_SCICA|nr:RNA-binding protein 38 [Sciurus carolinensis]